MIIELLLILLACIWVFGVMKSYAKLKVYKDVEKFIQEHKNFFDQNKNATYEDWRKYFKEHCEGYILRQAKDDAKREKARISSENSNLRVEKLRLLSDIKKQREELMNLTKQNDNLSKKISIEKSALQNFVSGTMKNSWLEKTTQPVLNEKLIYQFDLIDE